MAVLLLAGACSPQRSQIEISFVAYYGGEPLTCDDGAGRVRLTDLRFYVHKLHLTAEDGQELAVELVPDGTWQSASVALIDLENGEGSCLNGSAEMNAQVIGLIPGKTVEGISFEIGVPEVLNHADPLQAGAPLGYTEMHWHWASGYKFLRAGVETEDDGYFLHLGSSRCEGTIGNISGCRSANRPTVYLANFVPGEHQVIVDIGRLFADVDLGNSELSDCMSGPADEDCVVPFSNLGLDFETGESVGPASVFRTRSVE